MESKYIKKRCDYCKREEEAQDTHYFGKGPFSDWIGISVRESGPMYTMPPGSSNLDFCSIDCAVNYLKELKDKKNKDRYMEYTFPGDIIPDRLRNLTEDLENLKEEEDDDNGK